MDREKFDEMVAMGKTDLPDAEEPIGRMQIGFDVVEVQRVGLQPGDVLMITVKSNDLDQETVEDLRLKLQTIFPDNKVFVFAMGINDDVKISVVSEQKTGYCDDCSCGKKEEALSEQENTKPTESGG